MLLWELTHTANGLPEDFDDASEMEPTLLTATRRFTVIETFIRIRREHSWDRTVTFPGPVTYARGKVTSGTGTAFLDRVTISGNDVTVKGRIFTWYPYNRSRINVKLDATYLFESAQADINGDGVVNILDLVSVVSQMGESSEKGKACGPDDCIPGDINWDGVVNILDLVLVAGALGEAAAAAPSIGAELLAHLNPGRGATVA